MWPELRDKRRGILQTSLKMDRAELIEVQLLQLETATVKYIVLSIVRFSPPALANLPQTRETNKQTNFSQLSTV